MYLKILLVYFPTEFDLINIQYLTLSSPSTCQNLIKIPKNKAEEEEEEPKVFFLWMIEQWMKLDSYNLYDKMVLKDFRFSI